MDNALRPQQQLFADEYLVDMKAGPAAVRAGYSVGSADVQAHRLLKNDKVSNYIQKRIDERSDRVGVTQDMVLRELALMGFANILDYVRISPDGEPVVDLSQVTRDQGAAISEVTVEDYLEGRGKDAREVRKIKFKLADKRSALVDVGKHLGMFKDEGVNLNLIGIDKIEVVPVEPEVKTIEGKANK